MDNLGKILITMGLILVLAGGLFLLFNKIPFLGKLPGDIAYRGKNFSFYFPLATSILVSILLSLLLYIIRRYF